MCLFAGLDFNDNRNHDDVRIPVITTEEHLATPWMEEQQLA